MNDILNGRFSIIEVVSENRLYKAVDIATGNMAALKRWEGENNFFKTELQALNLLQHPCKPQVLCSFEEDGCKYIALEWIDGEPLTNSNTLTISLNLAESAAKFISFISSYPYDLIHGDIKPSNLLLRDGKIYFLDFESSVFINDNEGLLREETIKLSDKMFIAPEFLQGKPCKQSDIYSLGVLLAWLLGGVGENGVNLSKIPIDSSIKALIKKAISINPEERFTDANEFIDGINKAKEKLAFENVISHQNIIGKFSIFIDCNVCFGWELANTAASCFGMNVGVFALTDKTQRKLCYYASEKYSYGDVKLEEASSYIFGITPMFRNMRDEWHTVGLIDKIELENGELFCSSTKLIDELNPEKEAFIADFNRWAKDNFDLVIFITDRYDDKPIVKNLISHSDCTIATPLADIDDIDACKNYYERFGSNVLYTAWEYNERYSLPEDSIKIIVGDDKYLGFVSHSEERNYKRNFMGKIQPIFQNDMGQTEMQYVNIINRLFDYELKKMRESVLVEK